MLKSPEIRRIALIGGVVLVGAAVLGAVLFQDALFRMSITPQGRFAQEAAPPRPDYARPESWALRPAQPPPGGWETPWGIDTFFIPPASAYSNAGWNVAIDDADALERLKQRILPNHAGPFLQAGPVYAPLYRQASLHSEINVGGEGDGAFALAYDDVLRAFDQYMAADNRHRGIVLAGVGQGGLYAQRLLADRFQVEPLKSRLAAAYIIDAATPADFPGKAVSQPLCAQYEQIHCIVAWKTIVAGDDASRFRDQSPVWTADWKIAASKGKQLACVNPLRWTLDDELSARVDHRGAARAKGADDLEPSIIEKAVTARCKDGVLEVERPSAPELQADNGAGAQYKTPELNLFYADIVPNLTGRMTAATAWLDNIDNARKPAEPLPPAVAFEDAPIYRPDGQPEPVQ
ncbi:MAG TPA: DUF3089 domain-containing protein [Hyphomonadaceae bacterium]|nr:DUF3089 domain-containing protein [Hyphomonadaceae bacterium]